MYPRDDSIRQLLDRPIAFQRPFVTLTGNVTTALLLSQALYWSSRTRNVEGWFYKTQREWEEETGLTRREQDAARKRLRQFDWWEESLRKANGVPTLHFRLDVRGLYQSLLAALEQTAPPSPPPADDSAPEPQFTDDSSVQTGLAESYKRDCTEATNGIGGIVQTGLAESYKPDCANRTNPITETTNRDYAETTDREREADASPARPAAESSSSVVVLKAPQRAGKTLRHTSPHLKDAEWLESGYIAPGTGQNAVQVYYERFAICHDPSRLTAIQEDDLIHQCPDLKRLREVMIAYSRTNYRPRNLRLIFDWYHGGIPGQAGRTTTYQNGAAAPERTTHNATPESESARPSWLPYPTPDRPTLDLDALLIGQRLTRDEYVVALLCRGIEPDQLDFPPEYDLAGFLATLDRDNLQRTDPWADL